MFVFQQRQLLLDIPDLSAVTVLGSFRPDAVEKFKSEEGPYKLGNFRFEVHLTPTTLEGDREEGAILLHLDGSIYESDLEEIEDLFDLIYAYYQLPLRDEVIDALFELPDTSFQISMERFIHIMKRAGANKTMIAKAAGVDPITIDSWVAGDCSLDLSELSKLEKAFPLLPWDLIVFCYNNNAV